MTEFHMGIDPYFPLADYTHKQEKCQTFAHNAGIPISEATMVSTGTKAAITCGRMELAWREWKHQSIINQTWNNWKTNGTAAFAETCDINQITADNCAFAYQATTKVEQAAHMVTLLKNLANAVIQKNNTAEKLVATNKHLAKALANANAAIAHLHLPNTPAAPATPSGTDNHLRPSHWSAIKPDWANNGYCWTHGHKVKIGHSSARCTHRKPGHITSATCSGTKSGSNANKGWTATCWSEPAELSNEDVAYNVLANSFPHNPGCANPPDLSTTAFIESAASKLLVMPSTTTSAATNHASITIIQPGGDRMQSTHSVDLLLQKLPPNARMAHSLPGLTNNLLSIAILCDARCKVFFHATGCEVTLNGAVIFRGWRDPHHCLWCVRIVNDGWTSNHCIHDNNKSHPNIAVANSLYNCDNTQQLRHFYHACLFSPVLSTLINAINKGYLKGFLGLTSQ
jgi:hypothetical protein